MEKAAMEAKKAHGAPARLLILTALLILAAPLLLFFILHLPAAQTAVIAHFTHRIESATPFTIKLGGYSWRPFAGVRLNDLSVQFEGKEILRCERTQLSYELSLERPYFFLKELCFEKPALRLERDREGRWLIPGRKKRPKRPRIDSGIERSAPKSPSSALRRNPLPRLRIISGVVSAEQNGRQILSIKDVTVTLSVHHVFDSDGDSFQIDIGEGLREFLLPSWGK